MSPKEKYKVVRKLAAGGMAEVFVGESSSLEGFKKSVAIKRVLPHLAENKKFLAMFLDEARISLGFNHANVVQTFDLGRSDSTYFIVMEYVDGTDLKKVWEYLKDTGQMPPLELSAYIISEVCRGLAYAHKLTDGRGTSLRIVHRDVSPPNILLSKEGEIKIVDFGLAKATGQLEKTDPGVVKGKFAYLAPETARGDEIDFRADIFACGILLFELLTGQRLFFGSSDIDTIERVREAKVPSIRELNTNVPESLESIVNKALALEPEDRFETCGDMAEALSGFLFEYGRRVTSRDVEHLVKQVGDQAPDEAAADVSIIDQLIQEEMIRFSSFEEEGSDFLKLENGQPSYGAAPLDPSGFSQAPPPRTVSDTPLTEVEPALAQMLEGDPRLSSTPPLSGAPEGPTQTGLFFIAILAAAAAAGVTIAAAYALGLFP
jgi:serine/threonine protein kinase